MRKLFFIFFLLSVCNTFSQSKKEQIELLTTRIDSLKERLQTEKNSNLEKTSKISELNTKVNDLKTQVTKLNSEIETQNKEFDKDNLDLKSFQNQVKIKNDSILILKNELDKIQLPKKDTLKQNSPLKEYKSVVIGTQTWMAVNLDVTTFKNGDPIPEAKTNEEWENAGINKQPAWCYYDNDPANGAKYGKLYNWFAVNDKRGLAPVGYHIPKDEEWTILTDYIGDSEGKKLKSTNGWKDNGNGINKSGFTALPGGVRSNKGWFDDFGYYGYWWTSTDDVKNTCKNCTITLALNRGMFFNYDVVNRGNGEMASGFSVRCIKD